MLIPRLTGYLLLLVSISTNAADAPVKLDWQDYRGTVYQSGDLYIAGQPLSAAAMEAMATDGITTIVNLRTPAEMANRESAPIDEPMLAESLNLDYHHLPSGGPDYPFSPRTVEQFAAIVANAPGKVMLHCASARRASHLWAAYLIRYKGVNTTDAVRLAQEANFGTVPLEGYLARPLSYE